MSPLLQAATILDTSHPHLTSTTPKGNIILHKFISFSGTTENASSHTTTILSLSFACSNSCTISSTRLVLQQHLLNCCFFSVIFELLQRSSLHRLLTSVSLNHCNSYIWHPEDGLLFESPILYVKNMMIA